MLRELLKARERKVYVHLADSEAGRKFLKQAEREGFTFGDGVAPTERQYEEVMAVYPDGTINYVGAYGRVAFQCGMVEKLEYC